MVTICVKGFPGGLNGRESGYNAGNRVQSLSWEDPLEKEWLLMQYSFLDNSLDRGAWQVCKILL